MLEGVAEPCSVIEFRGGLGAKVTSAGHTGREGLIHMYTRHDPTQLQLLPYLRPIGPTSFCRLGSTDATQVER